MKYSHYMFLTSLISGTILTVSASSWFTAWLGLEINLMSFIPLLLNKLTPPTTEAAIKYFLTQAMASMIIIFSSLLLFFHLKVAINLSGTMMTMALSMKAGMAPFHFWFPQIMEFVSWFQATLMLTWQKIAPFILLSFQFSTLTFIILISSSITGLMGGMNQTCLKKILTFSSFIHSSWMLCLIFMNFSLWLVYYFAYMVMVIAISLPCSLLSFSHLTSINTNKLALKPKLFLILNLLSLAGLPPFLGFFLKLISINIFTLNKLNPTLIYFMILASLISFYFYSRICYSSILMKENTTKSLYLPPEMKTLNNFLIMISLMGNLFLSFLVLLS